jgi:FdhD protein
MAGIQLVCAIGAPSSLAVEMAKEFNITLIGFLKSDKMNIYSGEERIVF